MDLTNANIIVTGGAGFVGSTVCRRLRERGVDAARIFIPRSHDYDLTTESGAQRLYADAFGAPERTDLVLHLAGAVGGIGSHKANPGRFFHDNMAMALHLIEGARRDGFCDRGASFVLAGTICSYAKETPVPFQEDDLWIGYPSETTAPYGVAKRAAWQMLDAYRREYGLRSACPMLVNIFGPGADFDPASSHVVAALIRKCVEAQESGASHIDVWGTGIASREFVYVDDAADGLLRCAEVMHEPVPINIGAGRETTIKELVETIARLTGFEGELRWDPTKPDGQPRVSLDVSRAHDRLGWSAQVGFEDGLRQTIDWWVESRGSDTD